MRNVFFIVLIVVFSFTGLNINSQSKIEEERYHDITFEVKSGNENLQDLEKEFQSDFNLYKYYSVKENNQVRVLLNGDLNSEYINRIASKFNIEINIVTFEEVSKRDNYTEVTSFYEKYHNKKMTPYSISKEEYEKLPQKKKEALKNSEREVIIK